MAESRTASLVAAGAAGGAAFSYLASPILVYAHPLAVYLSGTFVLMGAVYTLKTHPDESVWWARIGFLSIIAGTIGFALTFQTAANVGDGVRAACYQLQTDMLSAHPKRPNVTDIFTAMGCKPQLDHQVVQTKTPTR